MEVRKKPPQILTWAAFESGLKGELFGFPKLHRPILVKVCQHSWVVLLASLRHLGKPRFGFDA